MVGGFQRNDELTRISDALPWDATVLVPSDLAALFSNHARVVMLDNRYVEGSSTPIARRDDEGNTWQQRRLADGSTHEVLKNFPTEAEAREALGGRAQRIRWTEHTHYWVLDYTLE